MLKILTGRESSGKTNRIMERISHGSNSILIVPEQYSHEAERMLCTLGGDGISDIAEVLSFTRLSNRVFSVAGGLAVQYLDDCGRLLAMRLALNNAAPALKLFSSVCAKSDYLETMLTVMDELKNYGISGAALDCAAEKTDGRLADKLKELAMILEAYDAVTALGHADPSRRMEMLAEKLGECDYAAGKDFYIDCFSDFSKLEMDVIEELIAKAQSVTVALTCDDDAVFTLQQDTVRRLKAAAKRRGVKCVEEKLPDRQRNHPEFSWLDRGLNDYSVSTYNGDCTAISITVADNRKDECHRAAAECCRLVFEKGLRWRDISLAVSDMDSYCTDIERIFSEYNVPVYLSKTTDITSKPAISVMISALDAVTGGYEYDDVFRYLKSGFANIDHGQCDKLENYALQWNIRGSQWKSDWTFNPLGFGREENEKTDAQLKSLNEYRNFAVLPLIKLENSLKASENGSEMVRAVYDFLEDISLGVKLEQSATDYEAAGDSQSADECSQLWAIITDVLDQCYSMLSQSYIEETELAKLLKTALSSGSIGTIPVYLDAVSVGDIARMRHRQVNTLMVLGANDSLLPTAPGAAGIITEDERLPLRTLGIELAATTEEKLEQEIGKIHSCLCCPEERLIVSYPEKSETGDELRPSFVVQRLKALFPNIAISRSTSDDRLWSSREAFYSAFTADGSDSEVNQWIGEKSELSEKIRDVRLRDNTRSDDLSPAATLALYGKTMRLSATRIDAYNSCRYKYFLQYGLGAEARKQKQFSAPEYGTFVHYILENLCAVAKEAGGFDKFDRSRLPGLINELTKQYTDTQLAGGLENKSQRFRYLFRRLTKTVTAVAENVFDELSVSDFQPLDFELQFGGGGEFDPVTVLSGGAEGAVTGKVDRVDGYVKDDKLYLRVVDYKTGKKAFNFTDIRYGMGLQMLIYLFALQNSGKLKYGMEIEPAGVMYLPARDEVLSASRYITDEALQKLRDESLTRSGLLLDDDGILNAMEHFEGQPRYLPIKLNKEGMPTGGIASAEQLGKLSRHVDKALNQLVKELGSGSSAPNPYKSGVNTPCQWCDYAAACRNEKYRLLKTYSADKFWGYLAEEEKDNG